MVVIVKVRVLMFVALTCSMVNSLDDGLELLVVISTC